MLGEDFLYFDYNQKSSSLLFFFLNAVIFSIILFRKGIIQEQAESKWLALFIFLCGLYVCPFMLGYGGWYSKTNYREFMFFVPFQQLFLIGPVLYFYILSLLYNDFTLSRMDFLHFIPFGLYLLYTLVVFVTDKFILDEFYFYADGRDKDLSFWYQLTGLISMLTYLVLGLIKYRNYTNLIQQEVSYVEEISFRWINHYMLAFAAILVLRVLFFILNPEWDQFGSKYWYYLSFSVLGMYILISGYSHSLTKSSFVISNDLGIRSSQDNPISKYVTPEIEHLDQWKEKLTQLFEEYHLYTNSHLTLTDVATILNTNRNLISSLINQGFDMNFNDFINYKRVQAVEQKIKNGEHNEKTLLGIALEAGFNSKSTFNRAFKKHTALTPREYIAKKQH
ncbi:hypothetical protein GCM10009117_10050 [Gangjinia marincola]|uniref:HTH araC/xylS-type domain-containing protein n=1 Tax=Gangjinia marincola TaxID=578463 RepID=A0ABP3XU32_9FLAO